MVDRVQRSPGNPRPGWQRAFLDGLAIAANVSLSCQAAGVSRQLVYTERKRNPAFAQQWDEALADAVDNLAAEAHRRAVEGVERTVYYQGDPVGTERVYSDTLLIYLLKIKGGPEWRQDRHVTMEGAIDVTGRIDLATIDALLAEQGIALPPNTAPPVAVALIEAADDALDGDARPLPADPADDDYADEMIG